MFYYISGKLAHKSENFAVIDANGIGFKIYSSTATLNSLGDIGADAKLYTYVNLKTTSDILDIYGFYTMEELNLFEMIISVNGIGTKTAISLLSNISPSKFALCVISGDSKYISDNTHGLGKKGAERLVLELRDKFKGVELNEMPAQDFVPVSNNDDNAEAVSALVVLGYSAVEAKNALKGATGTLEDKIKFGLKNLMKG